MDGLPGLSQGLPETQMQRLVFSPHALVSVVGGNLLTSVTPGTMPTTPSLLTQGILGASCWGQLHYVSLAHSLAMPVCQKKSFRPLLWTALPWSLLPTLASLRLLVS